MTIRPVVLVLLCALLVPALAGAQEAYFTPQPVWRAFEEMETSGIALGDVDGDGDLDLVCSAAVIDPNVMYRNEGGVFGLFPSWVGPRHGSNRGATSVALGDVDGDGDLDLVCGGYYQPTALHLNEQGTFAQTPAWEDSVTVATYAVALADVDGDDDLDLVCGNWDDPNVLYHNEGGVFTADPVWIGPANQTARLALGDVDGDGDLDLVCGNAAQPHTLYYNEGGKFGPAPAWSGPFNFAGVVALGDVDGDGDLDLVCSNETDTNSLHLNEGGVFAAAPVWSSGARSFSSALLGDVDGDGDMDLVGASFLEPSTLYRNDGGTLTTDPVWTGPNSSTNYGALADIDGDGRLDLVYGNWGEPHTLHRNISAEFSTTPDWSVIGSHTTGVALGDVDGDADLDLVMGNADHANLLYHNEGGVFGAAPAWTGPSESTESVALGDVDGDGDLDLVTGNVGQPHRLYPNDGGVFVALPRSESESSNTNQVVLGDIDGDGDPDLVCSGETKTLFYNVGGRFEATPSWTDPSSNNSGSYAHIALGDVDGDGDLDLVGGNVLEPNTLFRNEGGIFATTPAWTGPVNGTFSVALGDIDGDGDLDLACGNFVQSNTVYLNVGGTFDATPAWVGPSNQTIRVVLGDVDGDGDLDLVCGNRGAGQTIYRNDGGYFGAAPAWTGPSGTIEDLAAGDVDADGDLDLVFGSALESTGLHLSRRTPAFTGTLLPPTRHQPNNSAFLRQVRVSELSANLRLVQFTAFDVESDPVQIVPGYRFAGSSEIRKMDVNTPGLLATSPDGVGHAFTWDVSRVQFDPRDAVLHLKATSVPARVSTIQHVATYDHRLGRLVPRRPELRLSESSLRFPTVTVGDTVIARVSLVNAGNEPLQVNGLELPSTEMQHNLVFPFELGVGAFRDAIVQLMPVEDLAPDAGSIRIYSSDPVRPDVTVPIEADVRSLSFTSRLLAPAGEIKPGEALTVLVTPAPQVRIETGRLVYRISAPTPGLHATPLFASGQEFVAIIPGENVTEAGLAYWVEVWNLPAMASGPEDSVAVPAPAAILTEAQPNSGAGFLEGRDVGVLVELEEGTVLQNGVLYYRAAGSREYQSVAIDVSGVLPEATIPGVAASARGIEYWVEVQTLTRTLTDPATLPGERPRFIPVTVTKLAEAENSRGGQYRMVSVPLDFGPDFAGTLESILSDQTAFGSYDPVRWRAYRYAPGAQKYVELADDESEHHLEPGKAFWLVSRDDSRINTAPISGTSPRTDRDFAITLAPGWNQIGNPFSFPVAWDSVRVDTLATPLAEGTLIEPPVAWAPGKGYRFGVDELTPFRGYWVKNIAGGDVVLRIPPREIAAAVTATPAAGPEGGWRLTLRASADGVEDAVAGVGVAPGAATAWDRHDRSEPPLAPGRALSLFFPHGEWEQRAGRYATDIREDPSRSGHAWGHAWHLDVDRNFASGTGDGVTIEISGSAAAPAEARILLVDRRLGRSIDLRAESRYTFFPAPRSVASHEADAPFVLIVGTDEYLAGHPELMARVPDRTTLHPNYPNPFNPSTVIRYELAAAGHVTLRIYDVTGALVHVLEDAARRPGVYEIPWSGTNLRGESVASGVYFYRLTAGDFVQTRKMVLVK